MAFNESSSEIYKAPNFCIGVYPDSAEPPTAPEYAGAVLLAAGENINEPPKRLAENQDWLRSRKFEDAGAPAGTTDELCAMLEGRTVDEIIETIAKWMREP
jgi:hypothetical protein